MFPYLWPSIHILSAEMKNLKSAFRALESSAKSMGIVVNENKTNFMAVGSNSDNISNTLIDGYNFERVKRFV